MSEGQSTVYAPFVGRTRVTLHPHQLHSEFRNELQKSLVETVEGRFIPCDCTLSHSQSVYVRKGSAILLGHTMPQYCGDDHRGVMTCTVEYMADQVRLFPQDRIVCRIGGMTKVAIIGYTGDHNEVRIVLILPKDAATDPLYAPNIEYLQRPDLLRSEVEVELVATQKNSMYERSVLAFGVIRRVLPPRPKSLDTGGLLPCWEETLVTPQPGDIDPSTWTPQEMVPSMSLVEGLSSVNAFTVLWQRLRGEVSPEDVRALGPAKFLYTSFHDPHQSATMSDIVRREVLEVLLRTTASRNGRSIGVLGPSVLAKETGEHLHLRLSQTEVLVGGDAVGNTPALVRPWSDGMPADIAFAAREMFPSGLDAVWVVSSDTESTPTEVARRMLGALRAQAPSADLVLRLSATSLRTPLLRFLQWASELHASSKWVRCAATPADDSAVYLVLCNRTVIGPSEEGADWEDLWQRWVDLQSSGRSKFVSQWTGEGALLDGAWKKGTERFLQRTMRRLLQQYRVVLRQREDRKAMLETEDEREAHYQDAIAGLHKWSDTVGETLPPWYTNAAAVEDA